MNEPDSLPETSWLAAPLRRLLAIPIAHPAHALTFSLGLALVGILITVAGLKFKTSRLDLLSPHSAYNQRWLAYLAEFGEQDDAVIVVDGDDAQAVSSAVDELTREFSASDRLFDSVMAGWDLTALRAKGLHYLPIDALTQLEQGLQPLREAAKGAEALATGLQGLRTLNDRLEQTGRASPELLAQAERQYARVLVELQSLGDAAAGGAIDADRLRDLDRLEREMNRFRLHRLEINDGRLGFVLLKLKSTANEFARGSEAIVALRKIIADARIKHPALRIGATGMPILEFDEMNASQADMSMATWLGLIAVFILFTASFGSWRYTIYSVSALLIGMAWSFGYLTLAVGHLNILTVSFAAILIGLGIDFSIHVVACYLQFREEGLDSTAALLETASTVGPGIVTGGLTTALAFCTAALTQFVGIAELGIIAGGGIMLCMAAALIALPAMIQLRDRDDVLTTPPRLISVQAWSRPAMLFPGATLLVLLLATAGISLGIGNLKFDHNLLNLQPEQLESVAIEKEILSRGDQSFWCALSVAESVEHARELKSRFERLPSVSRVEDVASLLPEEDSRRRRSIVRIGAALEGMRTQTPPSIEAIGRELERGLGLLHQAVGPRHPLVIQLGQTLPRLTQAMPQSDEAALRATLPRLAELESSADPDSPRLADLPPALTSRFVGKTGKYLVRVYAKGHIWDNAALQRFVADVETIDPRVTGHPVQTFYASRHMQRSYILASIYSLIAVAGVLMFDFRSIRYTLLAMLPLGCGVLQMLGIMGLLGIPFNPANMIGLPLILGIGVDDGVHLVHDFRRSRRRYRITNSTAVSVMLTSATTIAGFAVMILARHQGLRSLGQVLTIGVFTCLVNSLFGLPALFRWMTRDLPEELTHESAIEALDEEPFPSESPAPPFRTRPRRQAAALAMLGDDSERAA